MTVLIRLESCLKYNPKKLKLLLCKKWPKLENNPAQKIQNVNRVPNCYINTTVHAFYKLMKGGVSLVPMPVIS